MTPTLPTARDIKKQQLLKACDDAQDRYNANPNVRNSKLMDEALDEYNAFQNQAIDSDRDDKILKILAATLALSMLVYILGGCFH